MRTIIVTIALAVISFNGIAQNQKKSPTKYCAEMNKNSKIEMQVKGTALKDQVKLKNGTKIQPDGTIIKPDGSSLTLKVGECIDKDGVLSLLKVRENLGK